jgi:hypothetical protein
MKAIIVLILICHSVWTFTQDSKLTLKVVEVHDGPVIEKGDPGTEDNKYGFEGGTVIKYKGEYHLFTAERFEDPELVKMRLGYWKSPNGTNWERISTIFESSGNFTGKDEFASFWAPMPYFNEDENRWNIFYVAYRSKPNDSTGWYLNYDGRIVRAYSETLGYDGLKGPYKNAGVVLKPGPGDGEWEGLQGTDSFYAFQIDGKWYAFYGSAQTQTDLNNKYPKWTTSLARAPKLAGPWEKWTEKGYIEFHERFAENPIITKLECGKYAAMLDGGGGGFGYSFSEDGINWERARYIHLENHTDKWWTAMRTPLCLIPENDGTFTVFFTAYTQSGFAELGKVSFKISP